MFRLVAPLVLSLLLLPIVAHAARLIVVLPLDVSHAGGKLGTDARVDLEEMLRDVASDSLTSQGWTVLTGETTLQVLLDNGVDGTKCGDQSCHLSMAREIKAEKFLSGNVRFVEGSFTASIRLIDTATGHILASQSIEGATVRALRADFRSRAAEFFAKGGMMQPAPVPSRGAVTPPPPTVTPPAATTPTASKGRIKIVTEPPGATVTIDGTEAGVTPLRKEVDASTYRVKVALAGFKELTNMVTVNAGEEGFWSESLTAVAGATKKDPKSGLEFVSLPGGTFHYGCEPQDTGCDDDEKPGKTVAVAPFWMGKTHVTVDATRSA